MKLFDTLDKKPKLYHIAVLSVAVFIIVFLLLEKGMEHIVTVNLILGLYYLSVIVLLVHAFIGQLRYNPYSYNTILYFGYALFVGLLLLTQISVIRQYYLDPEMFYEERVFASSRDRSETSSSCRFPSCWYSVWLYASPILYC